MGEQGQSEEGSEQASEGEGETSASKQAKSGKQGKTSKEAASGSTKGGELAENKAVKDGAPEEADKPGEQDNRTASQKGDSDAAARRFKDEPWVAKLPPELRKAIRARPNHKAPRGYEERLRRYFESHA